jgi:hypothetical protein
MGGDPYKLLERNHDVPEAVTTGLVDDHLTTSFRGT